MNKFWRRTQALKAAAPAWPTDRDGTAPQSANVHFLAGTRAQDRQFAC